MRIRIVYAVVGVLAIAIAVKTAGAFSSFATLNWIIGQSGLTTIQKLDSTIAGAYFEHPNAYILGGSDLPKNAIRIGNYTALDSCKGDTRCRSFSDGRGSGSVDHIRTPGLLYDNEAWPRTPFTEQKNPCQYMAEFTKIAHANHFFTIMAPDQNLMQPGGRIQSAYPGNETENWQSYVRHSLAACAAQSGTDRFHIMAQPFESSWCCNPAGNAQGSESDFINYVQQAALQARSVNPKLAMTVGLSTNPKYKPTPLMLYQDSLDVQNIVDGIWMNTAPQFRPPMAVQYYELVSGLVPFYLEAENRLNSDYPAGSSKTFSLRAVKSFLLSVSGQTFPAGTVVPAGAYKFEPFTGGAEGSAAVSLEVGYCDASRCTHRIPIISRGAWNPAIPAGDPGVVIAFSTSTPTTLPAGGPYSLYFAIQVTSPGNFDLNYNSGIHSTNIAIPRPSTMPAPRSNASVFFAHGNGNMDMNLPASSTVATFNLGTEGASRTFVSGKTYPQGTVIPADAYGFQYWTDGSSGAAQLGLEFGYCLPPNCGSRKPVITAKQNWAPTIIAGAKGAANPYGAFTTRESTTLPPGGPYNLYWTVTVKTPAPFNLLYGSASAPTNLATSFIQPRKP